MKETGREKGHETGEGRMGAASRKNKGLVLPLGSWCGWEKAGGGGETQDGKCAWGALGGMRQCEDIVTGCNEGKS